MGRRWKNLVENEGFGGDLFNGIIEGVLMGFHSDSMGFHGISYGLNVVLIGLVIIFAIGFPGMRL